MTSSSSASDFHWRWTPTAEERLLASTGAMPYATAQDAVTAAPTTAPVADAPAARPAESVDAAAELRRERRRDRPENRSSRRSDVDRLAWPGFRGPARDSVIRGVRIETDWSRTPPAALWRRPIGPGWSSFAVERRVLYTQEQRGEEEIVAAYRLRDRRAGLGASRRGPLLGIERRRRSARHADARPRPRLRVRRDRHPERARRRGPAPSSGRATSATDTDVKVPDWGFASSPLVVGDLVIVAAAGKLVAYDAATGAAALVRPDRRRRATARRTSLTIDGVPQILLLSGRGAIERRAGRRQRCSGS